MNEAETGTEVVSLNKPKENSSAGKSLPVIPGGWNMADGGSESNCRQPNGALRLCGIQAKANQTN